MKIPNTVLELGSDNAYRVDVELGDHVVNDMDRHRRVDTWTKDHWDTINYYLLNSRNVGLGHLLFTVPKDIHQKLFGEGEPDATVESIAGRTAVIVLKISTTE